MAYTADQLFTSRAEIEKLLSILGVQLRIEDEEPDGQDIVDYYVEKGTSDVYFYVSRFAPLESLAIVPFIREAATACAAYKLTTHKGEPGNSALGKDWAEYMEKLELIRTGGAEVPGLILEEPGKGSSPVVSNMMVDMQAQPSLRLNRITSTGRPAGYSPAWDYRSAWRGRT